MKNSTRIIAVTFSTCLAFGASLVGHVPAENRQADPVRPETAAAVKSKPEHAARPPAATPAFDPAARLEEMRQAARRQLDYLAGRLMDPASTEGGDTPEARELYRQLDEARETLEKLNRARPEDVKPDGTLRPGAGEDSPGEDPAEALRRRQEAYARYQAAYRRMTALADEGKGETPETREAFEEYRRAKEEYNKLTR